MKKITLLLLLAFTSIIYAQDPIYVAITGECSDVTGTYTFNGLVNGKNNYVETFTVDGMPFVVAVGFDGVKWVLYANGDITDDGFDNIAVPDGLLPPFIGWVNTQCADGTMTISQVLNVDENYLKNSIVIPNPSSNYVVIENSNNNNVTLEYQIYDLIGREVLKGKSKFNEKISVESLTNGNYLIQIKNEFGKKLNKKFVKI